MIERCCGTLPRTFLLPVSLAGALSAISAGEPIALPLFNEPDGARPFLLVQDEGALPQGERPAAAAPEASAPEAEGAELRQGAPLAELTEALAAARNRLEQLNRAAEALAGAAALRAELAAKEEENRALLAELQPLRAARDEWQRAGAALRAELDERRQALERTTAETARLDGEVAAARWQSAQLRTSLDRASSERESAQAALDKANAALDTTRGQLRVTAEHLSEVNATLSAAEEERDTALSDLDEERARVDGLRAELSAANADLTAARTTNQGLEARLAALEEAAMLATDAARQNLLTVENQIAALSSSLGEADMAMEGWPEGGDAAPTAVAASADHPMEAEAGEAGPAATDGSPDDTDLIAQASLDELITAMPVERKIQVQSLLADLKAEPGSDGIRLTVPGGELFYVNGRQVRETAHESLAKVAELINLYKTQPVLIIGHTDAIGAPDYNQTLSERRAGLVKQFFIDHFDVEAARLSTQGMGEQEPIASNATAAGRRANRRVEVLILD